MTKLKYQADIKDWITRAEEDLRWAKHNFQGGFYAQTCFAAQQAAEKSLKVYLLSQEKVPPKIHSLPRLLSECQKFDREFGQLTQAVRILDKYYAPTRYPDIHVIEVYTPGKAEEAINLSQRILSFIQSKIV